ncbi:cupin domain-containing protein [Falsirhodobacter algicola]|uniref:Cupin domain-containing protein n=1 Tax=Falsirhodobacter algicola TaxID=2692330 RepID=A0A8J8MTC7_9RHOB|nr:cupin domain-containing protein [Falsirhodobacter algicola]QUS36361.1 cupin domain-containing protein [Falsirhodobacter algicola]
MGFLPVPPAPRTAFSVRAEDVELEGGEDPAFGTVTWRTLMGRADRETPEFVLGIAEYGPEGTLPPHRHDAAEFYFGLSGAGTVTIDGVLHPIAEGVALYVPGNAEHAVLAGPDGLRFAYGFAESSFDNIIYRFSNAQG